MKMAAVKSVVIFGATGNTGLCVVEFAVKEGLKVRTFVRDASKIPQNLQDKVEVVTGDVTNPEDVKKAVEGQDAVVVALGTRGSLEPTTLLSDGLKNILAATKAYDVKPISVCISSFLFWEKSNVPERYQAITEDHQRMLDALKDSDRDWIAVLPPHITDTPSTNGNYTVEHDKCPARLISKHDLGEFLIKCLSSNEHMRCICGIGTHAPTTCHSGSSRS